MKKKTLIINLASILAIAALLACIFLPCLVFFGYLVKESYFAWFGISSLVWILCAPLWFVPGLFGEQWQNAGDSALLRPGDKS